jgi:hypothetical protein
MSFLPSKLKKFFLSSKNKFPSKDKHKIQTKTKFWHQMQRAAHWLVYERSKIIANLSQQFV